jgi:hypothetical protein
MRSQRNPHWIIWCSEEWHGRTRSPQDITSVWIIPLFHVCFPPRLHRLLLVNGASCQPSAISCSVKVEDLEALEPPFGEDLLACEQGGSISMLSTCCPDELGRKPWISSSSILESSSFPDSSPLAFGACTIKEPYNACHRWHSKARKWSWHDQRIDPTLWEDMHNGVRSEKASSHPFCRERLCGYHYTLLAGRYYTFLLSVSCKAMHSLVVSLWAFLTENKELPCKLQHTFRI